ncbi:MAG: glutathione peroxidase [Pseudomonadota bacterium]
MLRKAAQAVGAMVAVAAASQVVLADAKQTGSAHDFSFTAIDGKDLPLNAFAGKAVLVVNTASLCGFTRQYEGLQSLWSRFQDRGLVVVGVPSNDFGGQEPKSESEIANFCKGAFGVTFPLTAKTNVRGPGAHPFYAWAKEMLGEDAAPRWNFHKYLIAGDGKLVAGFSTMVAPSAVELKTAIEAELKKLPKQSAALNQADQ